MPLAPAWHRRQLSSAAASVQAAQHFWAAVGSRIPEGVSEAVPLLTLLLVSPLHPPPMRLLHLPPLPLVLSLAPAAAATAPITTPVPLAVCRVVG